MFRGRREERREERRDDRGPGAPAGKTHYLEPGHEDIIILAVTVAIDEMAHPER